MINKRKEGKFSRRVLASRKNYRRLGDTCIYHDTKIILQFSSLWIKFRLITKRSCVFKLLLFEVYAFRLNDHSHEWCKRDRNLLKKLKKLNLTEERAVTTSLFWIKTAPKSRPPTHELQFGIQFKHFFAKWSVFLETKNEVSNWFHYWNSIRKSFKWFQV